MKESMVSFLNKYLRVGLAEIRCTIEITSRRIIFRANRSGKCYFWSIMSITYYITIYSVRPSIPVHIFCLTAVRWRDHSPREIAVFLGFRTFLGDKPPDKPSPEVSGIVLPLSPCLYSLYIKENPP